jgi:hypothetical protein
MMAAPLEAVDTRSAAEFRRPHDECVVQQAAPFEILEKSSNGLILWAQILSIWALPPWMALM